MPKDTGKGGRGGGAAGGRKDDERPRKKFSKRHDPMERPTLGAQMEGEEMKQEQPRDNIKKPHKKRIYHKMKRADKEANKEVQDEEDEADAKVLKQTHKHTREIRRDAPKEAAAAMEKEGEGEADEEGYLSFDSEDETKSQFTTASGIDDYENYLREEQNITEEEEAAFNMFLKPKENKSRTIADLIDEKMRERAEREREGADVEMEGGDDDAQMEELDEKVIEVYEGVAKWLSRYKSGKLPKAMKIVPSLKNWEQIVGITQPEGWSNNAYYACTRIFASCLQDPMAQRFFNLVLLPRVVEDLKMNKRLNYHLYQALKKACYKPAAFYKGLVLPLVQSGSCTLREATVLGSVIKKMSLPVLHSSAALLKISLDENYNGAQSIVLKNLLDKKYALPYRVLSSVVEHFARFRNDHRELPVKWHQAFLVFAQRYKNDIQPPQKEMLKEAMRVHSHYMITPEIRRELFSVQAGGPQQGQPMMRSGGGRGRGGKRGGSRGGGGDRMVM